MTMKNEALKTLSEMVQDCLSDETVTHAELVRTMRASLGDAVAYHKQVAEKAQSALDSLNNVPTIEYDYPIGEDSIHDNYSFHDSALPFSNPFSSYSDDTDRGVYAEWYGTNNYIINPSPMGGDSISFTTTS